MKKKASGNAPRRPVLMGNIVNIIHGIYQSINDSASHRFGIQWTGDIASDEHSLAREAETLVRASDNCIPYVNADCGGHVGNPDKELYLRWIQFGVLSPVFRPHCTNYVSRFREPWLYDEDTLNISREYIKMRYRLLPVIYREAYKAYVTGEPIFRGLGWEYPHEKRALNAVGEYMLGRNILIAPVTGNRMRSLEQSRYCTKVKGVFYDGTRWEGDPIAEKEFLKLDMDLNGDSPCSGVPAYNFSAQFETTVKFERDVDLFLRCDDGATVYVDGEMVFKDDTMHSVRIFSLCLLKGGEEHKVVVRYFQAGGEASCGLYYAEAEGVNPTYLPAGKWLDVFSGKIRKGGIQFAEKCDYDKMPLFVRLGALIPLAYDAKNTKEQKWDRLAFDYYPDKEAFDADSLYEDDGETTAYQNGAYRISPYKACYDEQEKCYIICFEHSEGDFSGDRFVTEREITLRFHRICKEKVFSVTLNGEEIEYKTFARDRAVFPFAAEGGARDSEVIIVRFRTNVSEENKIKFFMSK